MMRVLLALTLTLCCLLLANSHVFDTFWRLKSELSVVKIEMGDLMVEQEKLFEELTTFEGAIEISEGPREKEEEEQDDGDEFGVPDHSDLQAAQVHTDVVFVGFPSSAVDYIEQSWMDSLEHESNSEGSYGGKVFDMPGEIYVKHHYHLLHVSFHAADLVRDTMLNMMRSSLAGDTDSGFVINAWEIEHMLNGLTKALRVDKQDKFHATDKYHYVASNTIYVLNIDFEESLQKLAEEMRTHAKYSYRNGFTEAQLDHLAKDANLVHTSKAVLSEQSSALREVIVEKDQYTPSLVDRDAMDTIQSILPTWYWYGYNDHYRLVDQQIHSREAIKETREWAQSYGDPAARTLEQRAATLLETPVTELPGGDFRYALAKAILRHAEELTRGTKQYEERDPSCGARTWISGAAFAWIDEGASNRAPHARNLYGRRLDAELMEVRPRSLGTAEWATLGDAKSNIKRNVDEGLTRVGEQVLNHYTSVMALAKQTRDCPDIVLGDFPLRRDLLTKPSGGGEEYGQGWAAEGPSYDALEQALASSTAGTACVTLLKQAVFLRNVYYLFQKMSMGFTVVVEANSLRGREEEADALDRQETLLYLRRLKEIHFDSLRDIIAAVGVDLKDKDDSRHMSILSDTATASLGYVLAKVLELSEQLTAPPVGVHLNPHSADLPLPGDTALISGDGHTIGDSSRKGKGSHVHRATDRERELSVHKVGLADFISSRVGKPERPLTAGSADADDYSLLSRALPPLSFPQRIEVAVYIVRLQSTYEPVIVNSLATSTSFDYRQLVRSLSDLALPNQELSVSLHSLDVYSGTGPRAVFSEAGHEALTLAMRSCKRVESSPPAFFTHRTAQMGSVYLDPDCVWAHLKNYDTTAKGTGDARKEGFRAWESAHQHVPIFVLSVDEPQPLFANSALDSAVVVADGILAVQNSQYEMPTGQLCGKREVRRKGRDPTSAVVRAAGRLIAGITSEHYSKHVAVLASADDTLLNYSGDDTSIGSLGTETVGQGATPVDVQCMFGRSVSFHTSAEAELGPSSFAAVEISAAHRARILRLIGHCRVLLRASVVAAPIGTTLRRQAVAVRTFLLMMLGKLLHEVEIAEGKEVQHAAAQANALYFIVEDWLHHKELPEDIYRAIEDHGGDLPLDDLENEWEERDASQGRTPGQGSFSLWDLIRFWPTVLFLTSFGVSLYWPKKKKPDRYL